LTGHYWETLHIDLRMVDTADFVIAYCPTNISSVGTVHEIALARLERKPVLFVSPPVEFPTYDALENNFANDATGTCLSRRRCEPSFRSLRNGTRAAFPISGTCRWSAARTSSTALASSFRQIKDATAGRVHSSTRPRAQPPASTSAAAVPRTVESAAATKVGQQTEDIRSQ
jgi:hypothetical protein